MPDWIVRKGEDSTRKVVLTQDNVPQNVTSATVTARLKDRLRSGSTANGAAIACSDSGNADFSAGIIEVVMTDTFTNTLTAGDFDLEILVVLSGGSKNIYVPPEKVDVRDSVQG